jgi:hypothetical protein
LGVKVIESAAELGDEFALLRLALGDPRIRVTCKTQPSRPRLG